MTGAYYAGHDLGLPEGGAGSVAPLHRRVVSAVVDQSLLAGATFALPDAWYSIVLVFAAGFVAPAWWNGRTPGLALLGLRLVAVDGDEVLTRQRGLTPLTAFARTGVLWCGPLSALIWVVSLDRDRRSWHDRVCRTIVLAAR